MVSGMSLDAFALPGAHEERPDGEVDGGALYSERSVT